MEANVCDGRRKALRTRAALVTFAFGIAWWQIGARLHESGSALAQGAPSVATDKPDYFFGETVTITGTGFAANTQYDVPVILPNGSIDQRNGSQGSDTVLTNASGSFTYFYLYRIRFVGH